MLPLQRWSWETWLVHSGTSFVALKDIVGSLNPWIVLWILSPTKMTHMCVIEHARARIIEEWCDLSFRAKQSTLSLVCCKVSKGPFVLRLNWLKSQHAVGVHQIMEISGFSSWSRLAHIHVLTSRNLEHRSSHGLKEVCKWSLLQSSGPLTYRCHWRVLHFRQNCAPCNSSAVWGCAELSASEHLRHCWTSLQKNNEWVGLVSGSLFALKLPNCTNRSFSTAFFESSTL